MRRPRRRGRPGRPARRHGRRRAGVRTVWGGMGGADCELLGNGWLAQPVNAWSSLAYLVAAGWVVGRRRDVTALLGAAALALVGGVRSVGGGTGGRLCARPALLRLQRGGHVATAVAAPLALGGRVWRRAQ